MTIDEAIKHCEEVAEKNEKECKWISGSEDAGMNGALAKTFAECASDHRQLAEWLRELKIYKDKDMSLINANPLEEAIRCAMCTNPMRSDRGCDGGCEVDEWMLKKVIKAVNGLIMEVESDDN